MSAFGTKKPGGDEAVQLTFPAEFSRAYKKERLVARYAPSGPVVPVQVYAGDDFQAQLHRERKAESDRRVLNGVRDTKMAEQRYLLSHQGYYNLPKVVLSQRRVGSNFGVGGGWNSSYKGEELVGGVIASTEGREWVKEALRRRKAELDALDSNQFDMPLSRAVSKGEPPSSFGEISRVELVSYLEQLYAQIGTTKLEFTPETFRRFLALLIRFATVATKEEMDDVYDRIENVINLILAVEGGRYNDPDDSVSTQAPDYDFIQVIGRLMNGAYEYMTQMYDGVYKSEEERKALSKAALKSSGLTEFNERKVSQRYGRLFPDQSEINSVFSGSSGDSNGFPPLPPSVSSMGSTGSQISYSTLPSSQSSMGSTEGSEASFPSTQSTGSLTSSSSGSTGQTYRGYNFYFNPLMARSQAREQQAAATSSRYSGRLAQGRFTATPESSEVSSGPDWISTNNAGWSNTPREQFGRQGVSELRGVRRYADEEEGEDLAQQQAGEDYEAITDEAGFQRSLANLRQSNVGQEGSDTGAVVGPPEGEYFDTWVSKGYEMPSQTTVDLLEARLPGRAGIDSFLSGFSGQRDVAAVRQIANDLRRAKDPRARKIESDDIYQVKKTLRPLLLELFE